jgi:hypothetical protein
MRDKLKRSQRRLADQTRQTENMQSNRDLTPDRIVSDVGACLQAMIAATHGQGIACTQAPATS